MKNKQIANNCETLIQQDEEKYERTKNDVSEIKKFVDQAQNNMGRVRHGGLKDYSSSYFIHFAEELEKHMQDTNNQIEEIAFALSRNERGSSSTQGMIVVIMVVVWLL